jgi:hypothetical protein
VTVQELMEELGKYPADAEVYLEDYCCGCANLATDVCISDVEGGGSGRTVTPYVAVSG